jgi:FtsH-binding integral membrane protein
MNQHNDQRGQGYPPQPYYGSAPQPGAHGYGPQAGALPGQGYAGYGGEVADVEQAFEGDISNPAVLAFAKKVYLYFASALAAASVAAFAGHSIVTHLVATDRAGAVGGLWIGSLVAFFASYLVVVFTRKNSSPLKTGLLYVFAGAAGFMLAPTLAYYVAAGMGLAIVFAFGIATVTFLGLTVYVLTTGKDFRSLGGILLIGILFIVGMWLMSIFVQFPSFMSGLLMGAGLLVFIGFTLYDTSKVVRDYYYRDDAVSAAINLLFDFIMLFRYILYFLGRR